MTDALHDPRVRHALCLALGVTLVGCGEAPAADTVHPPAFVGTWLMVNGPSMIGPEDSTTYLLRADGSWELQHNTGTKRETFRSGTWRFTTDSLREHPRLCFDVGGAEAVHCGRVERVGNTLTLGGEPALFPGSYRLTGP